MGGVLALSLTSGITTLSATQAQNCDLVLTGALSGNCQITNPNIGFYFVENLTTGSFAVTLTNGFGSVNIDQGSRVPVFADPTYGVRIMLPTSSLPLTPDLTNVEKSVTTTYTVANTDNHKTINCGGAAFYTVGLGATSGYATSFAVAIVNSDSRGKRISPSGVTSFILWPGQTTVIRSTSSGWQCDPGQQRYRPASGLGKLYVDPILGADTNDGLAPGILGALLNIQTAVDYHFDYFDYGDGGDVTIQLAAGAYSVGSGVQVTRPSGFGVNQVLIQGDASNPLAYDIVCNQPGSCFNARDQGILTLVGVSLRAVVSPAVLLSASQGSTIDVEGNCNFGNAYPGTHMLASTWASINVLGNYTVSGSFSTHISCTYNAYVNYTSFQCTITAPVTMDDWWLSVSTGGAILGGPWTFVNSSNVTGPGTPTHPTGQYSVDLNATLQKSTSVYPGISANNQVLRGGQVL